MVRSILLCNAILLLALIVVTFEKVGFLAMLNDTYYKHIQ